MGISWCYYVGFTAPHPAFVAGRSYWEVYPLDEIDLPNLPDEYLDTQHLMFQELRHFKRIATPIREQRVRQARAGCYGLVTELDDHIGQLEDTNFVYTSDHGEALGDHGLWLKSNLLEPAAHIPLVVAGSGIPSGRRVTHVTSHTDLAQALLEWTGSSGGSDLRGHPLVPLMAGELRHLSGDASVQQVMRDPRGILNSEVDTEAVTRAGFAAQERMLERFAKGSSEAALAEILRGRIGEGLARVLGASTKRRYG